MPFLARVLQAPSYGFSQNEELVIPTRKTLLREFFSRINFFADKRNWIAAFSWAATLAFAVPLAVFLFHYFSLPLLAAAFLYSMVVLGTHGTIWYHRYSTHRAFQFSHPFYRFIVKNLVVKIIPDELYVVSHHVHHLMSEKPGDPYNVNGGWLYCFLADAIHQPIARDLNEHDYGRVVEMMAHTGIRINSYEQYRRWGSVCHPLYTTIHFALNWIFWYSAFYFMGGHALATCLFGACGVWGIGVRTFNFDGHGAGKDKRQDGIDFYRKDHSINQLWPGLVTGEWHNNHHLFPNGARAGFLPYQLDYAWWGILVLKSFGGVTSYRDYKDQFYSRYYNPYLEQKAKGIVAPVEPVEA
jgi:sn-1 stearoyl-lipid 9-desaturase